MYRARKSDTSSGRSSETEEPTFLNETQTAPTDLPDNNSPVDYKNYYDERKSMFPELYRSDVSIHPSYTGLKTLPFCGASPLELWGMEVKNGYIRRVTDEEVKTLALEIAGTNVATTYIFAPKDPKNVLAISLPFLIMVIKNMKKYFTFEITVLDDKRMHRRFRISNFQSTTKVRPFCTTMPIGLAGGWNQIQFNLADFTRRAYGTNYIETTRMQIHANCRIRRIYFADRLYTEDELPADYKLLFPERRESRTRSSILQAKRPGGRSQGRISVGAVPPDEAPGFRADSEKLEEREERRTTPVASIEPSRTIVAPDGASRVQIEIEALESEGEETTEHEIEPESEVEEATIEEQVDQPEEAVVQEQETMFSEPVEEQREEQEEREEEKEEERAEEEEREEEEREEETIATATEDENEEAFEQDL